MPDRLPSLDNASPAGAVLKGWVESRFGLVPTHHRQPLLRFPSPAWVTYLEEKTFSRLHNNNIHQQLDLLFEFCQWALQRFGLSGHAAAGAPHLRLWRGSTRCDEQLVAGSLRGRHCTVRLNSLVSFSLSEQDAGCFGDWVFEVQVPASKLLVIPPPPSWQRRYIQLRDAYGAMLKVHPRVFFSLCGAGLDPGSFDDMKDGVSGAGEEDRGV